METAQAMTAEPEPPHVPHLRLLDPAAAADHRDRLYRAARSICGSREEAEDLVQDTYVRVLSRPRRIRHASDLPYLMRALRMTRIDAERSRARRPQQTEPPKGVEFVDRRRDLAVVQGGLTTAMELTANRRPFLRFPLKHHFEQRVHVAERPRRARPLLRSSAARAGRAAGVAGLRCQGSCVRPPKRVSKALELAGLPAGTTASIHTIAGDDLERKRAALSCYRTQLVALDQLGLTYEELAGIELTWS